ncbi:MAG TPA: VWA domain-containing protein, partial [Opitutaceae bacterium]
GVALSRLEHPKPATPPAAAKETAPAAAAPEHPRFVVLLSDGANNRGLLKPHQSAAIAKAHGVTVYTIGAGKDGMAPFPIIDAMGAKIGYRRVMADLDESALQQVAEITGGQYFRIDNIEAAAASFKAIDHSQRTQFKTQIRRPHDLFLWFVAAGFAFLLGGVCLAGASERQELTA